MKSSLLKTVRNTILGGLAVVAGCSMVSPAQAQNYGAKVKDAAAAATAGKLNIVETAAGAGTFKTLLTAATAAGLAETLSTGGPFTVFAPNDDAFAKLPAGTVEGLLADKEALKKVLLYHVVSGEVPASKVTGLSSAKTVEGSDVKITVKDGTVLVNNAKVIKTDIKASNGIIHVIDTVILPPAAGEAKAAAKGNTIVDVAVGAGTFNTLATALTEAGLVDTLKGEGPFTVFAPTDAAFAKLPAGTVEGLLKDKEKLKAVLLYHVASGNVQAADVVKVKEVKTLQGGSLPVKVDGSTVQIGAAKVTAADVKASNGVIHVIDTVLVP